MGLNRVLRQVGSLLIRQNRLLAESALSYSMHSYQHSVCIMIFITNKFLWYNHYGDVGFLVGVVRSEAAALKEVEQPKILVSAGSLLDRERHGRKRR